MQTRGYQSTAIYNTLDEWAKGVIATLVVMPTGTGKTIMFAKLCEILVGLGYRILILAHRGELLEQARDKIRASVGLNCSVEKAEFTCLGSFDRIVVGSVQTLMRKKRLDQFPKDFFDFIITDEAHHSCSKSYTIIYDHFSQAKLLGVTATPDRSDMKNVGEVYKTIAYEYTLPMSIKEGYLVPIKAQTIPLEIGLDGVEVKRGDYDATQLGNALDPYLEKIAEEMVTYCKERKTVVFLPLIATSQKFQSILDSYGFQTFEVNGESKDREEQLKAFEDAGKNTVMCNSMLLTEGWDCVTVDCVICLRPTKSRSLYSQIVGRGTRPTVAREISQPGLDDSQRRQLIRESKKPELLLLDFLWNVERLELCRPAHLVCPDDEVAKKMTEKISDEPGKMFDITDDRMIGESENDVVLDREEAMAKKLKEAAKKKKMLIDPLKYEMSLLDKDLSDYRPKEIWEMAPVSAAQEKLLTKLGICSDTIPNSGKASQLIERIEKRKKMGMATVKQIDFFTKRGFKNVSDWTNDQAKSMFLRYKRNGFMTPRGINPQDYKPS